MTSRQLEVLSYTVLALGLAGTWAFAHSTLSGGTATVPAAIGLYALTGLPFLAAAAGTLWMRDSRPASAWLLLIWIAGIATSIFVLRGSRGELLGEFAVFMLPVAHAPAVAFAVLIAWRIRHLPRRRAGDR